MVKKKVKKAVVKKVVKKDPKVELAKELANLEAISVSRRASAAKVEGGEKRRHLRVAVAAEERAEKLNA